MVHVGPGILVFWVRSEKCATDSLKTFNASLYKLTCHGFLKADDIMEDNCVMTDDWIKILIIL